MSHVYQIPSVVSPCALQLSGFNIPVRLSVPASFQELFPGDYPMLTVQAHLDTGASISCIDIDAARGLGLTASSSITINGVSGPVSVPVFIVDLSFPGYELSPFSNLMVGSGKFPLQASSGTGAPKKKFDFLIGRDMLSRWNVVWNGPTSSVFLSD